MTAQKQKREQHVIDAEGQSLGRMASKIAFLLQGKNKPTYVPHMDEGDSVEVVNAGKLKFAAKKMEQKIYRRHTMHPGGLKVTGLKQVFKARPEKVIEDAVAKMLPKNKLRTNRMKRLTFKKTV